MLAKLFATFAAILSGVTVPNGITSLGQGPPRAVIGLYPDPQNYCTRDSGDVGLTDYTRSMMHLKAQVDDTIALRPDFVIVLGDLTDTTGGADQGPGGGGNNEDDPNSLGLDRDQEWTCFRTNVYDRLRAAGIPVFLVFGNHDSCIDAERHFPRAEWLALPYARAAESGYFDCGAGGAEATEQRVAVMPTAIGNICVVGLDFSRSNYAAGIRAFANAQVGCGSNLPTIIARHSLADENWNSVVEGSSWMSTTGNGEIFLTTEGHFVDQVLPMWTAFSAKRISPLHSIEFVHTMINMQEASEQPPSGVCGNPANWPGGWCMHTGLSWWATLTITPQLNTISFQPRAPYFGGRSNSHFPALYTVDDGAGGPGPGVFSFTTSWCTRFGGPAC